MQFFYIFMTALFSSLIMVPFLRRWAVETGTVDVPDARKVHDKAIPRIGGIAIFMAFLFAALVYIDMLPAVRGILAGGLIIFFTGLIDDLHGLAPRRKFFGESCACLVTISVGHLYISNLGDLFGFGAIVLPVWLGVPFTLFAVVGVINAINLIDGLDGLAGGISVLALISFATLAYHDNNPMVLALTMALLGGVLGFLKYNFFPARIFMGDTGSLTVGFLLGFMAIFLTQSPGSTISPAVPVLILGLPILDTLWVMIRRVVHRLSPFAPDRSHLHHKFLDLGFQHRFTVLIIYGLSLFWGGFSVLFHAWPDYLLLGIYLLTCTGGYLLLRYVLRHPQCFPILSRDSSRGIRESVRFRQLTAQADVLVPVLLGVLILYLASFFWIGEGMSGALWQVESLLFVAGAIWLYVTRDPQNEYLLALLYVASLLVAYVAEQQVLTSSAAGWWWRHGVQGLLLTMGMLAGMKIFLRKRGEFFISGVDFLILAISVFLALASSSLEVVQHLSGTLLRGLILFISLKVVVSHSVRNARISVSAMLLVLFVIALRGALGQV